MVFQIIRWIIRGTDDGDLKFFDDSLGGEIFQALVCSFPNPGSRSFIEKLGDIEIPLQFEMGPMIERVTDGGRNRPGISEEFVIIAGVTGDIAFGHSMCPHRSPFVMITVPTVV